MELIKIELTDGSSLTLGFSNEDKATKFLQMYSEEVKATNEKIMKVYKQMFHINLDVLAIIRFYIKIERRLFHVEHKGVVYRCLNDVQFQLNSLTKYEN